MNGLDFFGVSAVELRYVDSPAQDRWHVDFAQQNSGPLVIERVTDLAQPIY